MTGHDFKSAQLTLGLNNAQFAAWLGVSLRTVEQWRATGPSKLGARAVGLAVGAMSLERFNMLVDYHFDAEPDPHPSGEFVRYSDVIASLALDWRE